MRVGWVPLHRSRSVASARLRSFQPISHLRRSGVDARLYERSDRRTYDVVVFQKAYTSTDIDEACRLREAGTRVVFDLCDNHWYRVDPDQAHLERVARLETMVALANLVTTSTPELARLVPSGAEVVDDALDPVASTLPARVAARVLAHRRRDLLWFGNAGTLDPPYGLVDLLGLVPILNAASKDRELAVTVVTDPSAPMLDQVKREADFEVRVRSWHYLSFGALARAHHACLLPAQSNPFTTAKTSNRAVTALRCGLAVVADDLPAYRRLGDCIKIGGWEANLHEYLDNPPAARADAERGRAFVDARFAPSVIASQWKQALTHAMDTPA